MVMSSEGVVISTITSAAHPLETTMVEDCTAWTNQVDVEAAQHHVKLEGQEVSTRRELRPQLKSHRRGFSIHHTRITSEHITNDSLSI